MAQRYELRCEPGETWAVIDRFTGLVVAYNGVRLRAKELDVAVDLVDLLNASDRRRLGGQWPSKP